MLRVAQSIAVMAVGALLLGLTVKAMVRRDMR